MLSSLRVSWRNMTRYKKRFLFTLTALTIGIIVMTGMLIAKETTAKTLEQEAEQRLGDADAIIQSTEGFFHETELDWLNKNGTLDRSTAMLHSQSTLTVDSTEVNVHLMAVSAFDQGMFKVAEVEGDATEEGLIITENAANILNKGVGDSVAFDQIEALEITAIVYDGGVLNSSQDLDNDDEVYFQVILPLETLQTSIGLPGMIDEFRFSTTGSNLDEQMTAFQRELEGSALWIRPAVTDHLQHNDVAGLYDTFDLIAILSIFISGFIAFNMIYASVIERKKEFAIMKSIGSTPWQINRIILQEIFILAVIALIIALPLGIGFGNIFQQLLIDAVANQSITYTLEIARPVAISGISGLIFPFIAALFPMYRAGKTPIMIAFIDRAVKPVPTRKQDIIRLLAGIVFLAVGLVDHMIAFLFLFIGLVLLFPFFIRITKRIIHPLMSLIFKFPGHQATRAMTQFEKRSANTSAMLAIGVSLALFMSALVITLPDGIETQVRNTFGGDVHIHKATAWNDGEIASLEESEAVSSAYRFTSIPEVTWETIDGDSRQFSLRSYPDTPDDNQLFQIITEDNTTAALPTLYLGDRAFQEWGGSVGDTMTIVTPAGVTDFHVKGTVQTSHNTGYVAFTSEEVFDSVLNWQYFNELSITLNDSQYLSQLQNELLTRYDAGEISIVSVEDLIESQQSALIGMQELMYGLLLLIIALSAIGISNTLFMNTLERTKELGIMRAIGFTKRQVRHMILAEGIIIGFAGVIFGVLHGILVIYLNANADASQALLSFTIPWMSLFLAIVGGLVFTILAAWLPSVSASRVSIKNAISYE